MSPRKHLMLAMILAILFFKQCTSLSPQHPAQDTEVAGEVNRYCTVCHTTLSLPEENLIAPPLEAVKRRYLAEFPDRQEFVRRMTAFVINPQDSSALMYGAVRRFQVMPKQPVDSSLILAIAAFIFDQKLDQPEWFEGHYQQNHPESAAPARDYAALFSSLDQSIGLQLNQGLKWIIDPTIHRQIHLMQDYLVSLNQEFQMTDYPIIAQAIRIKLPHSDNSSDSGAGLYLKFQDVLETKIAYLEQAETKNQGEYALLEITRQLLLFDAYFMPRE
ncbi:MAG: hypothetical protein KDC57_22060 [Saprospiraceae bacterium]|nr:hypothetical protein [Saprospiraceae bacterium]